jgi:hypothetical protein
MARGLLWQMHMNPLPYEVLAFPISPLPLAIDVTPLFTGLALLLALGTGVIACAAWRRRPRARLARRPAAALQPHAYVAEPFAYEESP